MTRIPSTSALRLLETAVRRRSYSHAATELNLSHSAVGQQIRRLEEDLGRRLFQRQGLSMAPTAEAQELAAAYVAARDTIERTWMRLAQGASQTTVVLSVEPAMARLWLAPRLSALRAALPEIQVQVQTTRDLANFESDNVDLAIRLGGGGWLGIEAEQILEDDMFPVCSPQLAQARGLARPQDLLAAPLLRDEADSWLAWFKAAGVAGPFTTQGPRFDESGVMLEAAAAGLGVALAREVFVQGDLDAGRLVRLFDVSIPAWPRCYLAWREGSAKKVLVNRLRAWIWEETAGWRRA